VDESDPPPPPPQPLQQYISAADGRRRVYSVARTQLATDRPTDDVRLRQQARMDIQSTSQRCRSFESSTRRRCDDGELDTEQLTQRRQRS